MGRRGGFIFFLMLVFGAYLITEGLSILKFPSFVTGLDKGIFLIGAVMILFGGIYFRKSMKYSASGFIHGTGNVGFLIFLLFALYLANFSLKIIASLANVISGKVEGGLVISGIMIIVGGIYFLKEKRY